jgi:cobalt-zinc-cadmium efflux system membrane fusion protein
VNARVLFSIAAVAVLMTLVGRPLAAEAQADAHAAISPASRPYASPNVLRMAATSRARRELVLAPVKRKAVTTEIVATAIIEPNAGAVAQVTSEIPARVVKLIAPLGQNVRPGEPLAILSSVELGQAKTEYLRVRSLESITRQHLAREESLYARKITPMKDLLEARAQHDTALAEYKAARERLRLLIPASQINKLQWSDNGQPLSEFPLTSLIAGTLIKRDLAIGAMIERDGPPPIVVVNLDLVWVMANIFEHNLANLKTGDQVNVTADAYADRVFPGQITYISDEVDRTTRAVRTRIEVRNNDHLLKPGMFARASIATGNSHQVLIAPESAVYEVDERMVVFVAAGNDGFVARPVQLGGRGDGTVEIVSGLDAGDVVVAKGGLALKSLIANKAAD